MSLEIIRLIGAGLAALLAFISALTYIQTIRSGKTKPHQFSMTLFFILAGMIFFSQLLAGGRESIMTSGVFMIMNLIIVVMAWRNGVRGSSRFDLLLLISALVTLVLWSITRWHEVAIILTVLVDLCATTMVVLKVRRVANSEAAWPWVANVLSWVFSLISLVGKPLSILYVWPIYGVLCCLVVVAAIYLPKHPALDQVLE